MSYYTCSGGPTFMRWSQASWCQIYMELTEKKPYAMRGHFTLGDWLVAFVEQEPPHHLPSYYTVERFDECKEGAIFDSWYEDNYADAFECQNALTRMTGSCYKAQLIGRNWLGCRYYKVVPTGLPPEPRSFCEFHALRSQIDEYLWSQTISRFPRPHHIENSSPDGR